MVAKRRVEYVAARGRKQVSIEIPLDLLSEIEEIVTDEDTTRQSVVIRALREYVKRYPKLVQLREMVH